MVAALCAQSLERGGRTPYVKRSLHGSVLISSGSPGGVHGEGAPLILTLVILGPPEICIAKSEQEKQQSSGTSGEGCS